MVFVVGVHTLADSLRLGVFKACLFLSYVAMPTEHSAGSDSSSDRDGTQPSRPLEAMSPDGSPLSSDEEKASVWVHHVAVGV